MVAAPEPVAREDCQIQEGSGLQVSRAEHSRQVHNVQKSTSDIKEQRSDQPARNE